jgi:hypothetical protein
MMMGPPYGMGMMQHGMMMGAGPPAIGRMDHGMDIMGAQDGVWH